MHDVENLVCRVESSCDADVGDGSRFEGERLPRLKSLVLLVNDEIPSCSVDRCFDEETVEI